MRHTRRSLASALALSPLALGLASTSAAPAARAQEGPDFESGALGLSQVAFIDRWGPIGEPVEVAGHYLRDMYMVGTQAGILHVAFGDVAGGPVALYVEFAWHEDGAPEADTTDLIEGLLPADADLTELYIAPPTPVGPVALEMRRYISASLAAAYDDQLPPEIGMVIQQHWLDPTRPDNVLVKSVSVAIRERTQRTG